MPLLLRYVPTSYAHIPKITGAYTIYMYCCYIVHLHILFINFSESESGGFQERYNVLDRNEKTIFSSVDQEEAQDFLRLNYDKLRAGEMEVASGGVDTVDVDEYAKMGDYPRDKEIEKKDKENATKLDVTKADKMMNTTAYKRMKSGTPGYTDKTNEGNQFAQAVQKAKAAGMKAGDKFKVGDDEYTLKDAIGGGNRRSTSNWCSR